MLSNKPYVFKGDYGTLANITLDSAAPDRTLHTSGRFNIPLDLTLAPGMTLQSIIVQQVGIQLPAFVRRQQARGSGQGQRLGVHVQGAGVGNGQPFTLLAVEQGGAW